MGEEVYSRKETEENKTEELEKNKTKNRTQKQNKKPKCNNTWGSPDY